MRKVRDFLIFDLNTLLVKSFLSNLIRSVIYFSRSFGCIDIFLSTKYVNNSLVSVWPNKSILFLFSYDRFFQKKLKSFFLFFSYSRLIDLAYCRLEKTPFLINFNTLEANYYLVNDF